MTDEKKFEMTRDEAESLFDILTLSLAPDSKPAGKELVKYSMTISYLMKRLRDFLSEAGVNTAKIQ